MNTGGQIARHIYLLGQPVGDFRLVQQFNQMTANPAPLLAAQNIGRHRERIGEEEIMNNAPFTQLQFRPIIRADLVGAKGAFLLPDFGEQSAQ